MEEKVYTELIWDGIDFRTSYQVYNGMKLWLKERDIEHRFEFRNGNYLPCGIVMEPESTIAFKFVF